MWSVFGRGRDSRLIDTDECLAYETPLDHVPYNAVFRFRVDPAEADERITEILSPYRQRGVPFMWVYHPTSQPADLRDRLARQGLEMAEPITGMTRSLDDLPPIPEPAPGLEVFEGPKHICDWMRLVSWRYDLPESTSEYLKSVYQVATENSDPSSRTHVWGARRNGIPVSKVVLHLGAGVAGIYGVATREEGRRLGLASLLTLHALHFARRQGVTLAVLHSTPMAVGLYERLGFVRSADFELWSEPGRLYI